MLHNNVKLFILCTSHKQIFQNSTPDINESSMSLSEEEDDFLSADEGTSDGEHETTPVNRLDDLLDLKRTDKIEELDKVEKSDAHPKAAEKTNEADRRVDTKEKPKLDIKDISAYSEQDGQSRKSPVCDREKGSDGDDDEETLAERIRERNLKLARKFSVEIAKNVKASAPIAVRGTPSTDRNDEIELPSIAKTGLHSSPPPAPPPTPALSSSLNPEEPNNSGTQYGWRLPAKSKPSCSKQPDTKSEQTRLALDRLSEQISQSEKTLFTKVAEDLKKVSIKSEDSNTQRPTSEAGAIPLISDLGGTLGGWSWGNATKLLASASQVTSQVSSVLDSVSQHIQSTGHADQKSTTSSTLGEPSQARPQTGDAQGKVRGDKVSMSATEAVSNDAFVDLTLNAMESLGKKAFGAMTERDESGSLQIKGLGRPWEHLLNLKRAQDPKEPSGFSSYRPPSDDEGPAAASTSHSSKEVAAGEHSSSLKNRKKHSSYEDDDKLD